jgi:putative colanic acid biosynthesis acetyltransferase WcaF
MERFMTLEPPVQDLSRFRLPADFRGRSAVVVQLWWIVQGTLFACSPQFMYGWRRMLLRLFGAKVGRGVLVRQSVRITYPWKVSLGDRCQVGDFAELYSLGPITIGHDAVVSQYSYLCTGSHDMRSVAFDIYAEPIVVEPEAWVCAGVFVYPGVTVKRGSVVGARSVLKSDTEPYLIYSGFPARVCGDRRARKGGGVAPVEAAANG